MRVAVFYNSISNPSKFPNKVMLMDNFAQGVRHCGDEVIACHDKKLPTASFDAGFVLGYTKEDNFRKQIIDHTRSLGAVPIFVDSNVLHYARPEHEWHRYSLNTVYPDSGTYMFGALDSTKWDQYSGWHNTALKPWRTQGDHILVLCQRPNGFNMFVDQEDWLHHTIAQIRLYTQRPIMIRMHPGDGSRVKQIEKLHEKYGNSVTISTHANIRDALADCWCAVGLNSTPNVVALIEGIPTYVEDPVHSWAADVAFTDLSLIENPPTPDRSEWACKIANIHWSNQEVKSGQLWQSIKHYISSAR
jgi:hypothetical protein